ncbi:MAG: glycine betaine/L-proline ABC transporter ATP-binding protein [Firmicutes bacterium]|nr:glycine betaine/L-proline ABC transporter ATP-binding protein [Bacillota bacterium]
MSIKLKAKNITKIFGKKPKKIIKKLDEGLSKDEILKETNHTVGVNNVSLEVKEGETFVIMGLSGSGKSTLIRCFNLLHEPTKGELYVDGENIVKYDKKKLREFRQKKMAMVFQHFGLFNHRSVLENVEYGLEIKKIDKNKRQDIAKETIKTVGLKGWENQMLHQLSGGMQQRVGLARALANDPDILLMDEPFSALDPLIRREMQLELIDLQAKLKKTIIFITHDVNEAFKLGDRVAVMKDGEVVQVGTPDDILSKPATKYIEDFVQDIDRSKVFQAKHIMNKPRDVAFIKNGLKVAVKEMKADGRSSIFVVDGNRIVKGIVTIDEAIEGIKENKTIKEVIDNDFNKANPEDYIQDLIYKAVKSKYPIAVTNEEGKLIGTILRSTVLSALA